MKELKNLLQDNEKIWFEISESEKADFLQYANDQGCLWLNGNEIHPGTDNCNFHMSVHSDLHIASVPYFLWFHKQFESVPKLVFHDFVCGKMRTPESRLISSTPNIMPGDDEN